MSSKIHHKMEKIDIAETEKLLEKSKNAVFVSSCPIPDSVPTVVGYDFNKGVDYHSLFQTYKTMGFQATSLGQAIDEINKMISSRNVKLSDETHDKYENDIFIKRRYNCTIFLGYTSNLVSSGLRETIRFLVEHNMVDAIVTTAGGIEEDFIKCLAPTYLGEFHYSGKELRDKGINRIGNLMVPNDNYCKFEDWLMPILDELLEEQQTKNVIWSPSKVIQRLGEKIDNTESIYYWAAKNHIPVFCPALTDGSLGDMMHFHSFRSPGLIIDILTDLRRLNMMAVKAIHSGMIVLGGGVVKHHICNANLMRNGADYAVFINTGAEYDGSDSGASPDEAISWGKIHKDARPVKVFGEATVLFPIVVAETFARHFHENKN